MIKRSAVIYFVIFVIVAAAAIYLQKKGGDSGAPGISDISSITVNTPVPVATAGSVFSAQDGSVTSIFIQTKDGKSVSMERVNGVWQVTQPQPGEALQSSVEEAASQITSLQVLDSLDISSADAGLDAPSYTLTIGFSKGNFVIAMVGDQTPSGNGYYLRKESGPVLVVGKYGLLALINMVDFPPYVPSPTPAASETPTATNTP